MSSESLRNYFPYITEAESYIQSNQISGPIELRLLRLPYSLLRKNDQQLHLEMQSFLIRNLSRTSLAESPLIKALLEPDGYSFRCFARIKPTRSPDGRWQNPRLHEDIPSSMVDALWYINSIGMEFNTIPHWKSNEHVGEWVQNGGFYASGYPLGTYMVPPIECRQDFITFILVYQGKPVDMRSPFCHGYVELSIKEDTAAGLNMSNILAQNGLYSGKTIKDHLDAPTLRDALLGVVVVEWVY